MSKLSTRSPFLCVVEIKGSFPQSDDRFLGESLIDKEALPFEFLSVTLLNRR